MAMPPALAHYWRNKRHKRHHTGGRAKHRSHSKALVRTRTIHVAAPRRRRRAAMGIAAGVGALVPLVAVAAALGYANDNIDEFAAAMKKIPGVKTFGAPLIVGGIALGVNRFVYANKWIRLIAAVGLVAGAFRLGQKSFSTEWVGADADGALADIE